jgi:predicted phage terminase large subunit-like protein
MYEGVIEKLIVNQPPRTSKSLIASVMFPCWLWTRNPSLAFMFASYSFSLSKDHAYKRRAILDSDWYQSHFGIHPSEDRHNIVEISNTLHGLMYTTSLTGSTVGRGGDYLILDDPNNPKETESETIRESTLQWFRMNWSTRANQKSTKWLVIQQRTHMNDITGFCISQGDWVHLKIPMEAEEGTHTSIGWKDPRSKRGELMWPERFGQKEVLSLKKSLGPYGSSGQLQQAPAPSEGGIIKRDWIGHYEVKESQYVIRDVKGEIEYSIDPWKCLRFATVDLAVTKKDTAKADPDYTVIAAWIAFLSSRGPILLLLDQKRDRLEGPDIEKEIVKMHEKWKFSIIAVEQIAGFIALGQQFKRSRLPIRDIGTSKDSFVRLEGDKQARAYGATPLMADRRFFAPAFAPWLGEYIHELTMFPNYGHDDCVDCTSSAVAVAEKYCKGGYGEVDANPGQERYNRQKQDDPGTQDPWKERMLIQP